MTEHGPPQMTRQEHSHDKSAKSEGGGSAASSHSEIHDRTGLYLSIIAVILSALALGISLMQPSIISARVENLQDRVMTAEREARVMQERWNDLKVELARRGIAVSDH